MSTSRKDDGVSRADGLILLDVSLIISCEANATDCGLPFLALHLIKFHYKSGVSCTNGLILLDMSLIINCGANITNRGLLFVGVYLVKFNHKSIEECLMVRDDNWLLREFLLNGLSVSHERWNGGSLCRLSGRTTVFPVLTG